MNWPLSALAGSPGIPEPKSSNVLVNSHHLQAMLAIPGSRLRAALATGTIAGDFLDAQNQPLFRLERIHAIATALSSPIAVRQIEIRFARPDRSLEYTVTLNPISQ